MSYTAHVDTFSYQNLPPREQWPKLIFDLPELRYPERINCGTELLDRAIDRGWSERTAILAPDGLRWSYRELREKASRIAQVLVDDLGLVPGNRVLLRGPNNPMLAACWFAVMKAGGVAVATMPLLRAKELTDIVTKAAISHALCDMRLAAELDSARAMCPTLQRVAYFGDETAGEIDMLMRDKSPTFDDVTTAAEDTCLIAFTSGTTGKPKGTMHFHRDVLAACDCWPKSTLRAAPDSLFTGSPPLAFTFGLGGLLVFPLRIGAASLLLE
jgi:2-aminobenzoate-CoA ligase